MKNNEVKKSSNYDIDKLDMDILRILMDNADTPFTEIAKILVVSGGTIHVRIKKMKDMGVLKVRVSVEETRGQSASTSVGV